jgi:hypothetical protein
VTTLSPSTVVSVRTIAVWILRILAFYLIVRGVYFMLQRLLLGALVGQPDMVWGVWQEIGNTTHRFSIGALMALFGIALALFNRTIAAWMIPAPVEGCPNCGFSRGDDDPTRCTECGLPGVNKK